MNVSAIIVTRGDVLLRPVVESLPPEWERVIWNNGVCQVFRANGEEREEIDVGADLAVYGRYAAIEHASHDLIYVQDDDCIVSDPAAIVRAWHGSKAQLSEDPFDPRILWKLSPDEIKRGARGEHVVCNMPQRFRHDFYTDNGLVGFGAAFHRDAPARAFERFRDFRKTQYDDLPTGPAPVRAQVMNEEWLDLSGFVERQPFFQRTCDIVFTGLTPRVLVDVSHTDREFASDDNRMWRQRTHVEERQRMRELVAKVRDA